jgi:phage terminase small subunit
MTVPKTGRPSKSTEEHKRDGTLRAGRHSDTPLLSGGRAKPTAPAHLSKSEKAHFRAIVKELWDGNILDKADRKMIELAAIESATIA